MSELDKIFGVGTKYEIDGKEFEVAPAQLKDLKKAIALQNDLHPIMAYNFMDREEVKDKDGKVIKPAMTAKDSEKKLYELLGIVTRNKHSREELEKINVDEVDGIIKFFLFGKRANQFG